jgi:hypothetical protein
MAIATHTAPVAAPAQPNHSIWTLGIENQGINSQIAELASRLDSGDPDADAETIAELEALLQVQQGSRHALTAKADAYCWVVDNLRAQSVYRKNQAKRLAELAAGDERRAQALEDALIKVLTALEPGKKTFRLDNHEIKGRKSSFLEVDEDEVPADLPANYLRVKTETSLDKTAVRAFIKSGGTIAGCKIVERTSWSIA